MFSNRVRRGRRLVSVCRRPDQRVAMEHQTRQRGVFSVREERERETEKKTTDTAIKTNERCNRIVNRP